MNKTNQSTRPSIGLAMSGAAARSVYYIGFLEVLTENNIKLDYIAASSGATIVAASYACGTLDKFKEFAFSINSSVVMSALETSKRGGIYNLDLTEGIYRKFTKNLKFEEVKPLMGFLAADIQTGDQVILCMGDIAHAARISCTVPGLFEPVKWGNRILVDGGLLNVVPGEIVRKAGVDIVLGIHIRASKHIFNKNQLLAKQLFNGLKKLLLVKQAEHVWDKLIESLEHIGFFDYYQNIKGKEDKQDFPGMFDVLGKSLDLAIEANRKSDKVPESSNYGCDLLVTSKPNPNFFGPVGFKEMRSVYQSGREEATLAIPKINKLIENYQEHLIKA